MPSFQDSAVLVLLALLLFGPKGLAKLARQLGKLMGEFRRASNEFRMQMDDEFRLEEQAEQQKKIEAMAAAAPVTPAFGADAESETHTPPPAPLQTDYTGSEPDDTRPDAVDAPQSHPEIAEPLPIASAGELHMMPPATGLPEPRAGSSASLGGLFDNIPHTEPAVTESNPHLAASHPEHESALNG